MLPAQECVFQLNQLISVPGLHIYASNDYDTTITSCTVLWGTAGCKARLHDTLKYFAIYIVLQLCNRPPTAIEILNVRMTKQIEEQATCIFRA